MATTFQRNILGSSTIKTQYRVFTGHLMKFRFRCLLCALVAPNNHTAPNSQPQPHHLSTTNHGFHLAALSSAEVHWRDELEISTRQGPFHQSYLDFWLPHVIFYTDASFLPTWEESLPHLKNLLDWIWPIHHPLVLALVGNSSGILAEFCKFRSSKRQNIEIPLVFFQWEDVPWLHVMSSEFQNKLLDPLHAINPINIQSERNGNYVRMEKGGHTQHAACMLIVVCCRWCYHPHICLLLIIYCSCLCL